MEKDMNLDWEARLEITARSAWLLVTDQGEIVLDARFTNAPVDRRALMLLLKALARWQGKRLCVVIIAENIVHPTLGLGRDGDEWPAESKWIEYTHDDTSRYIRSARRASQ